MRDGEPRLVLRMLERRVAQLTERLERIERELSDRKLQKARGDVADDERQQEKES